MMAGLYDFDSEVQKTVTGSIVGVDEAGRGPLAGPVVAAAVRLDPDRPIAGVNDSKKLSPKKREALYETIVAQALDWSVASASTAEIDCINILGASLLAMRRALEQLQTPWTLALIDGNQLVRGLSPERQKTIVGGDGHSACIAAASIIAKVTRDRMMVQYHAEFPAYNFHIHKGYPTRLHLRQIHLHGLSPIHRQSFCERMVRQTTLPLDPVGLKGRAQ
jgi:ribonuclease HII